LDFSGTQPDTRLDLKPLGPIAAPWRKAVCPLCNFVLYSDKIPLDDLTKCKKIVQEKSYKDNANRSSYFLLGLLYEGLKKDPLTLSHTFLKASWQESSDEKKLQDDLIRSLNYFDVFLNEPRKPVPPDADDDEDPYETAQLVKGEILRRLGRFADAKTYFSGLLKLKPYQGTFLGNTATFEISLCDKKDSGPHKFSEVKQTEDSAQPGAAQPATQPADKPSVKDQPSTPTSKDAPR
jgi:tetratricopeptide (TPR) repeat protein